MLNGLNVIDYKYRYPTVWDSTIKFVQTNQNIPQNYMNCAADICTDENINELRIRT